MHQYQTTIEYRSNTKQKIETHTLISNQYWTKNPNPYETHFKTFESKTKNGFRILPMSWGAQSALSWPWCGLPGQATVRWGVTLPNPPRDGRERMRRRSLEGTDRCFTGRWRRCVWWVKRSKPRSQWKWCDGWEEIGMGVGNGGGSGEDRRSEGRQQQLGGRGEEWGS